MHQTNSLKAKPGRTQKKSKIEKMQLTVFLKFFSLDKQNLLIRIDFVLSNAYVATIIPDSSSCTHNHQHFTRIES